jgi:hypothetical protein
MLRGRQDHRAPVRSPAISFSSSAPERFILTRQYLIEALVENIEKALGRLPVMLRLKPTFTAAMLLTVRFSWPALSSECSKKKSR